MKEAAIKHGANKKKKTSLQKDCTFEAYLAPAIARHATAAVYDNAIVAPRVDRIHALHETEILHLARLKGGVVGRWHGRRARGRQGDNLLAARIFRRDGRCWRRRGKDRARRWLRVITSAAARSAHVGTPVDCLFVVVCCGSADVTAAATASPGSAESRPPPPAGRRARPRPARSRFRRSALDFVRMPWPRAIDVSDSFSLGCQVCEWSTAAARRASSSNSRPFARCFATQLFSVSFLKHCPNSELRSGVPHCRTAALSIPCTISTSFPHGNRVDQRGQERQRGRTRCADRAQSPHRGQRS
jgi:hypothetical protein